MGDFCTCCLLNRDGYFYSKGLLTVVGSAGILVDFGPHTCKSHLTCVANFKFVVLVLHVK